MLTKLAAVFAALPLLAACQGPAPVQPARPLVIASFYPLYTFARQVAGDRAEVVSLVPAGAEPHDWEPSARDVARLEKAAVFIYNGGGFDVAAERLASNAALARVVVVKATAGLPLLAVDLPARGHDTAHGARPHADETPASARRDPHVWLDPMLAAAQAEMIRAGLTRADPANAAYYETRARAYAARLTALHETMAAGLADCRRREIVVSHAAFAYLARRYKLLQIPVMGLAPESEPSPAELARTVRVVRRLKATVIFSETLVSPKLADTLAAEVGAKTLVLNPLEGLTTDEEKAGKDYVSVMEENLRNLREALECR